MKVDIRVLATSNRNLAEEVRKGTFRGGSALPAQRGVAAPAAAARAPADILELAGHFARRYAESNGLPERPLSAARRR